MLLGSNLSSIPQYFVTYYLISMLKQGPDFHFEIRDYPSRTYFRAAKTLNICF